MSGLGLCCSSFCGFIGFSSLITGMILAIVAGDLYADLEDYDSTSDFVYQHQNAQILTDTYIMEDDVREEEYCDSSSSSSWGGSSYRRLLGLDDEVTDANRELLSCWTEYYDICRFTYTYTFLQISTETIYTSADDVYEEDGICPDLPYDRYGDKRWWDVGDIVNCYEPVSYPVGSLYECRNHQNECVKIMSSPQSDLRPYYVEADSLDIAGVSCLISGGILFGVSLAFFAWYFEWLACCYTLYYEKVFYMIHGGSLEEDRALEMEDKMYAAQASQPPPELAFYQEPQQ